QGKPLIRTWGDKFNERGIKDGDVVYVVANISGAMHLIGRMEVTGGVEVGESDYGSQCITGRKGTPRSFDRVVPTNIAKKLIFKAGRPKLCFRKGEPHKLDPQTLRAVRELKPESADLLDSLLRLKS